MKRTCIEAPPAWRWALVFAFLTSGCGGNKWQLAAVEGKVTLNKKPLAGVLVRFYPVGDGPRQLPYSSAITDADGVYQLKCQNDQAGAVVGQSRAVISWPSRDLLGKGRDASAPSPSGPPIPVPYTVAAETPLLVTVKPGPRQVIDLPLEE
jgi:hypothetical protein